MPAPLSPPCTWRCLSQIGGLMSARRILVQALSDDARNFYEKLGFDVSPLDPMILVAALSKLKDAMG